MPRQETIPMQQRTDLGADYGRGLNVMTARGACYGSVNNLFVIYS